MLCGKFFIGLYTYNQSSKKNGKDDESLEESMIGDSGKLTVQVRQCLVLLGKNLKSITSSPWRLRPILQGEILSIQYMAFPHESSDHKL